MTPAPIPDDDADAADLDRSELYSQDKLDRDYIESIDEIDDDEIGGDRDA